MPQPKSTCLLLNSSKSKKRVRKLRKIKRKSVLKMLAVMEAAASSQNAGPSSGVGTAPPTPDSTTHTQEFLSSGRTGRRNALPDILGQHAVVTSSDLPGKLQALSTTDKPSPPPPPAATPDPAQPGTSKS